MSDQRFTPNSRFARACGSELHLSPSELEAFVVGVLDPAATSRLEAHVAACAECQARLEQEARLELAFAAVATRTEAKRAREEERPRRALPAAAFGVLAMAATLALWVTARGVDDVHAPSPTADDPAAAAAPPTVSADASAFTASLDTQADGSRLGVRD
ncbi:MAG TPA: zf-HC2 domain-containing protein [Polyangiaceae bacterium]|nr:zf-HC2 domain-containing protein [Polyangiaceae bacterium]